MNNNMQFKQATSQYSSKYKKVISLLFTIFVLTVYVSMFSHSFALDDGDVSYGNRLIEDEIFDNQEIYIFDDYAVSTFYNYPIKEYDISSKKIIDIRSGTVISNNSYNCPTAEMDLLKDGELCYLQFDSSLLEQYIGLSLIKATLSVSSNKCISDDITDAIKYYLSNDNYSLVNGKVILIPLDIAYPTVYDYQLELSIETQLPEYSTSSVTTGYYFIYPYGSTDVFAIDANNASDYKVFLWNFTGTNTQVWYISVSSLNAYATLKNVYSDLYLRYDISNMDVILDSGGVVGNRFVITSSGSYITIKPWLYTEKIVKYESLSNYSNVCLTSTPSTVINNEKWSFIPVSQLGSAGSYRYTSSTSFRCYSYAMHLTTQYYVPNLSSTYTVTDVANNVITDSNMITLGKHCRKLESGLNYVSYVKTSEYRIAVRVGCHYVNGLYWRDYHFMEQLNDGTWAHKPGLLSSRNDISNPESDAWNLYDNSGNVLYQNFYDSEIIFLAVSNE